MKNELIVIKVGSSTLEEQTNTNHVKLDYGSFANVADQANELAEQGARVALVSSGAGAAGYATTGEERTLEKRMDILQSQRMACIGQTVMMAAWQQAFRKHSKHVGQVLFTKHELETDEGRELCAVSNHLLKRGDAVIANENDALSHAEIQFGDNDTLAARYAALLNASGAYTRTRLILLSDVYGVYRNKLDASTLIDVVHDIDTIQSVAGGAGSIAGTGGMQSKFEAAKICRDSGIDMYIAHGRSEHSVTDALNNVSGTHFVT